MEGWIKLHRSVQHCFLWSDKPFAKGQAWIDLLMLANYENKKGTSQGRIVTFKRGVVHMSITDLADRWGWSRKKASRFLELLESDSMVSVESSTHGTTITIVNYDNYQDQCPTNAQQMTDRCPTDAQPMPITKKEKKEKKDKEINIRETYFPGDEILNQSFMDFVQMRKSIKKPLATDRAIDLAIKKLMELSGGDNDLAIQIINQSVMNSWQSFYPLKEQKQKSNEIDWSKI